MDEIRMTPVQRRAVFLDLNGTIVLPLFANSPREYQLIAEAAEAIALLCGAGFVCPVITVQSRIEKGIYSETEFHQWFDSLKTTLAPQGAVVVGPYVCPHRYRTPCECKKPSGLLYRRAAADLELGLAGSFVIGDTRDDVDVARNLGCCGVLVRTGWHVEPEVEALADHVADDVLAAARWITASMTTAHHRLGADAPRVM
jgi:D-glycero-D-manno-heptose 1,7-bisphosphate phosphatase